ncbi:protein INCREASED PETAL GROWTH ANISOTROPY 1-like [Gastrolobium bilobum]|uniref:protein INCREASED PETAL GROWTH ANISOTROPY 1-like n=1 Tax=Gastrolobium bilobum TaxID=150636 RepID=UPI002AB10044|nr:protein INCREASED PETAL GROWTH ANISOTROPY 1-like [Gastrolobium bilobum]
MVAGRVKVAMGLQKSPAPPTPPPSSANKSSSHKSRSIGAYFPRSSAQVQPRPPNVADLLRLVEDLRERESQLKTELLEHKLLKETVAIVPVLENEIIARDTQILRNAKIMEEMEAENHRLRNELEELKFQIQEEKKQNLMKTKALEDEMAELKKTASDALRNDEVSSSQRFQGLVEVSMKSNLIKNLKKTASVQGSGNQKQLEATFTDFKREVPETERERERPRHSLFDSDELAHSTDSVLTRSRAPRIPKPPPRPSSSSPHSPSTGSSDFAPSENNKFETEQAIPQQPQLAPPPPPPKAAPPPPPPPPKGSRQVTAMVRRVPEVVEFYHSLMKRESQSRRDSSSGMAEAPPTANARDMIGEIENRSSHLLAIKTDVETQGDFIRYLIKEVEGAAFTEIEDVVLFVKWLDDELSYLVDERAVLKHFDWPEQKADALREAAFGYCDLKKVETEASSFLDDPRQPCGPSLKKMQALLEKLEHGVYNISRMRESATNRYKVFQIPVHWMLDNGLVSQIKLASVKLAMKYMKRVSAELETGGGGPEEEELIVQGVRFAFRVHQFAGGFDVETMRAFQELRDKARSCHLQCHSQQQKFFCRSATC